MNIKRIVEDIERAYNKIRSLESDLDYLHMDLADAVFEIDKSCTDPEVLYDSSCDFSPCGYCIVNMIGEDTCIFCRKERKR